MSEKSKTKFTILITDAEVIAWIRKHSELVMSNFVTNLLKEYMEGHP